MTELRKYPRTHHVEGSGIQPGDEALQTAPFGAIAGSHLVIEEKMDGSNSGIRFRPDGRLLLQSRGHYLTGGGRERHFALFKTWASRYAAELREVLTDRYLMFGEWLYAKHTIYYTDLPHYFLEFDILDMATEEFLSTERRTALLAALPFVVSVKVLNQGPVSSLEELTRWIGPSSFIAPDHRERLREACQQQGLDADRVLRETDPTGQMEGLYVKVEADGVVKERYKYVRPSFLTTVLDSQSHWVDRPIVANGLREGVDLFATPTRDLRADAGGADGPVDLEFS